MKLPRKADRSTVVVGVSLTLLALVFLYIVLLFWSMRQDFASEIDAVAPRTARLLGMLESYQSLQAASGAAGEMLRDVAYPAGRDSASVAAALQQDVRALMRDAGLTVTGSQILATRQAEGYERLTLDISVEGNIDALDSALAELEGMRPLIFVESLKVKPERMRSSRSRREEPVEEGDPRRLAARFNLFALRLQQ
ncbi:MAG: hypothetical protein CME59_03925 [Halioglobus sp.]|nr:hypothetical protein [Halioglobus sp.]